MVPIKSLKPGDVVKIVDAWPGNAFENTQGFMDRYLGTFMTVMKTYNGFARMVEDQNDPHRCGSGWQWYPAAIECVIGRPDNTEVSSFGTKSITSFLKGGV